MKALVIALIASGVVAAAVAAYFGYQSSDVPAVRVVSVLSSTGSVVSFFGLAIAFVQIWSVRRIAEATREAAEQTRDRLAFTLTISDISKASKMIDEIQAYISSAQLDLALLRVGDLHYLLIEFGEHQCVRGQVNQDRYNLMCRNVGTELAGLRNAMQKKVTALDLTALNKHLVTAKTQLSHIEGAVKFTEIQHER